MGNQQEILKSINAIPSKDGYYINLETCEIYSTVKSGCFKKLSTYEHYVKNSNKAYMRCRLGKKHYLVHRLVLMVKYNRELLPTETVNHIDGNTLNNNSENLEIATHLEQVAHAVNTGLYCSGDAWYKARGLTRKE